LVRSRSGKTRPKGAREFLKGKIKLQDQVMTSRYVKEAVPRLGEERRGYATGLVQKPTLAGC